MKKPYWDLSGDGDDEERDEAEETNESPRRIRRWWQWLLLIAGLGSVLTLLGGVVAGLLIYKKMSFDLPDVTALGAYQPSLVTEVYDRNEELIAEFFVERRRLVPLEDIPLYVRQATIAAEDARFHTHSGVDFIGIARAMWVNLRAGETREGASTITQQVARNLFLTRERTFTRKVREAILAYRIEQHYSKNNILQIYLNQIFYGHNAYGLEAAAQLYFAKSVQDLTLPEGALLASLPPAPNVYSPLKNPQRSLRQRGLVLRRMVEEGYLTPDEAAEAEQAPLQLRTERQKTVRVNKAPYFVEEVRKYLEEQYGPNRLYHGGFTVYTTLDMRLQKAAEKALQNGLLTVGRRTRPGVYYGPVRHLDLTADPDENTALITDVTLPNSGDTTVHIGDLLRGVILELRPREMVVQVKDSRGVITPDGWNWVRSVDGIEGLHRPQPAQFLQSGDVIRVRVRQVGSGGQPHQLALEYDPHVQGALLTLEVGSGHILAMMGGYDFATSQFNRASQAKRQPGSAFKPVIFAAAIEEGMTPVSIVKDNPIVRAVPGSDPWEPSNYDEKFLGPITLRKALTKSRNLATVDVLEKVGVKKICRYAQKLGIRGELPCVPALALGSASVTLTEMTAVYGVFANGGVYTEPIFITKIEDRFGQIQEERYQDARRAMRPSIAYTITSLLESVVQEGTGKNVRDLARPAAGKTGTTNGFRDAWFIGYTPELITGVWVGLDDHKPLGHRETGGKVAAPIWLSFMQEALAGQPLVDFPVPPGVRFVRQPGRRGLPPRDWAPKAQRRFEVFVDDTAPPVEYVAPQLNIASSRENVARESAPTSVGEVTPVSTRISRRELNRLDRRR